MLTSLSLVHDGCSINWFQGKKGEERRRKWEKEEKEGGEGRGRRKGRRSGKKQETRREMTTNSVFSSLPGPSTLPLLTSLFPQHYYHFLSLKLKSSGSSWTLLHLFPLCIQPLTHSASSWGFADLIFPLLATLAVVHRLILSPPSACDLPDSHLCPITHSSQCTQGNLLKTPATSYNSVSKIDNGSPFPWAPAPSQSHSPRLFRHPPPTWLVFSLSGIGITKNFT